MGRYGNSSNRGSFVIVIALLLLLPLFAVSLFSIVASSGSSSQEKRENLQAYYAAKSVTIAVVEQIEGRDSSITKTWEEIINDVFKKTSNSLPKPSPSDYSPKWGSTLSYEEWEDAYIEDVNKWKNNFISKVKREIKREYVAEFEDNSSNAIKAKGTIYFHYQEAPAIQEIKTYSEAKNFFLTPSMIYNAMEAQIETTAYAGDGTSYTMSAVMTSETDQITSTVSELGDYQFLAKGNINLEGLGVTGSTATGNIISKEGDINLSRLETLGLVLSEQGGVTMAYTGNRNTTGLTLESKVRAKKDLDIEYDVGQIETAIFDAKVGGNITISGTDGNTFKGTYYCQKNFTVKAKKTVSGLINANRDVTLAEVDFTGEAWCNGSARIGSTSQNTIIRGPIYFGEALVETGMRILYLNEPPQLQTVSSQFVSDMNETALSIAEAKPFWVNWMESNKENINRITMDDLNKMGTIDTSLGDKAYIVQYTNSDQKLTQSLNIKGNNRVFIMFEPERNSEMAAVEFSPNISIGFSGDESTNYNSNTQLFIYSDSLKEMVVKNAVNLNGHFYLPNTTFTAERGHQSRFIGKICADTITMKEYRLNTSTASTGIGSWKITYKEGGL